MGRVPPESCASMVSLKPTERSRQVRLLIQTYHSLLPILLSKGRSIQVNTHRQCLIAWD